MADESDLLIREVDEDVRRDKLNDLWKRYGRYVIGAAVGIVLAVAANSGWQAYLDQKESAISDAYQVALDEASVEGADVASIWAEVAPNLEGGYVALAGFNEAAALSKAGKFEEAVIVYDRIGQAAEANDDLKGLAQLLAARIEMEVKKLPEARGRLALLAADGSAWKFSAQETLALIDLMEGNNEGAYEKYLALSLEPIAPQSITARAREMVDSLSDYAPKESIDDIESPETNGEAEPADELEGNS